MALCGTSTMLEEQLVDDITLDLPTLEDDLWHHLRLTHTGRLSLASPKAIRLNPHQETTLPLPPDLIQGFPGSLKELVGRDKRENPMPRERRQGI